MKKPIIYTVDWPWQYGDDLPGPGRGAQKHYQTMATTDKYRSMSMGEAEDFVLPATLDGRTRPSPSVLFLWRVKDLQHEALRLMLMWGYTLKSELCWVKKTVHGKDHFGMGHVARQAHEICLIGVRGKVESTHSTRSTFETVEELTAPLLIMNTSFDAAVGEHSEKPDRFYEIVRELYPEAAEYHDVFARVRRPNWIPFGDQLPPEAEPEPAGVVHVRGAKSLVIQCSCGHEDPAHNWSGICQSCNCEAFRPCHGKGFRNGHCKHPEPALAFGDELADAGQ